MTRFRKFCPCCNYRITLQTFRYLLFGRNFSCPSCKKQLESQTTISSILLQFPPPILLAISFLLGLGKFYLESVIALFIVIFFWCWTFSVLRLREVPNENE